MLEITQQGDVIWVDGEIDMSCADELRSVIREHGSGPLILDVSNLTFIDSSGLKVLFEAARARNGDGDLVLRRPARSFRRLLEITVPGGTAGLEVQE